MFTRLRTAGFLFLALGLMSAVAVAQMPPTPNGIEWDAPPKGGANPESPAAKTITGKGKVTVRNGWKCTKVDVGVVEIPTFKVIDSLSGPPTGNDWSFSTAKATSNTTCVVSVTAYFEEIKGTGKEDKSG